MTEAPFVRWMRQQLPWNDPDLQRMDRRTTRWTRVFMVIIGTIGIWNLTQKAWFEGCFTLAFVILLEVVERRRQENRRHLQQQGEMLLACMNNDIEEIAHMGGFMKCPGCDMWLREDDLEGQATHMEAENPDIVAERRAESARWDGWEDG